MSIEITVPQLPESVEEATIAEWHKKPGDTIERDENVVDLETDKVMLEVPVTSAGVLGEIRKEAGETVNEGDVLAVLNEGSEAKKASGDDQEQEKESEEKAEGDEESESTKETKQDTDEDREDTGEKAQQQSKGKQAEGKEAEKEGREAALSPAVRKLVAEHDIDPSEIEGSGKDGRVLKSDVLDYLGDSEESEKAPESKQGKTQEKQRTEETQPQSSREGEIGDVENAPAGERVEQRVPMTRIRARIAERLVEAQHNAAMLTTFNEVDLHAVHRIRDRYKDYFQKQHDVRLGYMSFFVKASVEALKRYPVVNASIDEKDIVYHSYFDIGIAVSSRRGLVVPVLRDADQKTFAEVEQQVRNLGRKAGDNKLTMDDLKGGTFSITNGGVFGSMLSTPILNPPQSAILGMHAIQNRPMVVDGEVTARPVMYLALSYDHRIVDGREAVLFLRTIKDTLEDPARLLLQI